MGHCEVVGTSSPNPALRQVISVSADRFAASAEDQIGRCYTCCQYQYSLSGTEETKQYLHHRVDRLTELVSSHHDTPPTRVTPVSARNLNLPVGE